MSSAAGTLRASVEPQNRMLHGADALVAVHAEVVEGEREFAAVAVAGAAGDHLGEHATRCRAGRAGRRRSPAGTRKLSAAERTWSIRSASSTRPFGRVCW